MGQNSTQNKFSECVFSRLLKEVVLEVLKYLALSCVVQMLGEADRTHSLEKELKLTCIYPIYLFPPVETSIRIITQISVRVFSLN